MQLSHTQGIFVCKFVRTSNKKKITTEKKESAMHSPHNCVPLLYPQVFVKLKAKNSKITHLSKQIP